jgi:hypothetical protein
MKAIGVLLSLFLAACATYAPPDRNDLAVGREIEVGNLPGNLLFEKSTTWLARNLYSQKGVIARLEPEQGIIVANATIDYPAAGELDAIAKIQYSISFVMREEIRGGQILLTFDNFMLNVPKVYTRSRVWPEREYVGGYSVPIRQSSDFQAARRGVLAIAARLEGYLREK